MSVTIVLPHYRVIQMVSSFFIMSHDLQRHDLSNIQLHTQPCTSLYTIIHDNQLNFILLSDVWACTSNMLNHTSFHREISYLIMERTKIPFLHLYGHTLLVYTIVKHTSTIIHVQIFNKFSNN